MSFRGAQRRRNLRVRLHEESVPSHLAMQYEILTACYRRPQDDIFVSFLGIGAASFGEAV